MMNRRARHVQPREVSGCKLSVIGYKITGLSEADPVTTWSDQSGNGSDATQSTSGNKPTYQTGEINGHPAVLFDGSNDFLEIVGLDAVADWAITDAFTVLAILKSNSGSGSFRPLWFFRPNNDNNENFSCWYQYSDNNAYLDCGNWTSGGRVSGPVTTNTNWKTFTGRRSGSQGDIWENGANVLSSSAYTDSLMSGSDNFILGANDPQTVFHDAYYGEFSVLNYGAVPALRQRLEGRAALLYAIRQ